MCWFIVLTFALVWKSCNGRRNELDPFISWSNKHVRLPSTNIRSIRDFTDSLKNEDFDVVIVYTSQMLTFDSIMANGDVFSSSRESSPPHGFKHLKQIINLSKFHYWTGFKSSSSNWQGAINALTNQMKTKPKFINKQDLNNPDLSLSGILVLELDTLSIEEQDKIIWSLMMKIEKLKLRHLSIYTGGNDNYKTMMKRSSSTHSAVRSSDTVGDRDGCQIGGVFNASNTSTPCMLLCLKKGIFFTPDINYPLNNCTLNTPLELTWCCESDLNVTTTCADEDHPHVTVQYHIENVTDSEDGNECSLFTTGFIPRPEERRYEEAKPVILVSLKFMFPINSNKQWNVMMNASYTYKWEVEEPNKDNVPDEDENANDVTSYSILERQSSHEYLYEAFSVNSGLSYSCASEISNMFGSINGSNSSTVIINKIQVQPYNVTSSEFGTSDDCTGLFTYVTWMGVITMSTLLLVLYIGTVMAFSITTIDSFESPHGETIKVERLH
jgi:hypothetical protein